MRGSGLLRTTASRQLNFLHPDGGTNQFFGFRNRYSMAVSQAHPAWSDFFGSGSRFGHDRTSPAAFRKMGQIARHSARQHSFDKHHIEHVDHRVARHLHWRAVKVPVNFAPWRFDRHEASRPAEDGADQWSSAPIVDQHRNFATPGLYRWPRALLNEQTNFKQLIEEGWWIDPANDYDDPVDQRIVPLLPKAVPSKTIYSAGAWPFGLRSMSKSMYQRQHITSYTAWLQSRMVPVVRERGLQYTAHAMPRLYRAAQKAHVDEAGTMVPGTKIMSTDPRWGRHNIGSWAWPWSDRRQHLFEPSRAVR